MIEKHNVDDNCSITRFVHDNNAVSILERVPYLNTFNISLTFVTGSKDEPKNLHGICHLIEHLVFKQGESQEGSLILKEIENLAGEINAFTGKEETSFELTCLYDDYKSLVTKMFDLIFNFKFSEKQFKREKEIVIQENNEDNNDYELVIDEMIFKNCLPEDIGHSIGGDEAIIKSLAMEQVKEYYNAHFRFDNLIISVCAKAKEEELIEFIDGLLKKYNLSSKNSITRLSEQSAITTFKGQSLNKKLESVVLNFISKGPTSLADNRFAYSVLNQYLCDGMSSRLFSVLREEKGYVYSVLSSIDSFYNCGLFCINTSTTKKYIKDVQQTILEELNIIGANGIPEDRLELEKSKLIRAYLMGFDDPLTRSEFYTNCEIFGKSFEFPKLKENILKVNNEVIKNIVKNEVLSNSCFYICE